MSLKTYKFDPEATLTILHKFDSVFAALCTGKHPLTGAPLPGAQGDRPLVTQTQKVRIRSLAEATRYKIFSFFGDSDSSGLGGLNGNGFHYDDDNDGTEDGGDGEQDEGDDDTEADQPWLLEATNVYDQTLMLLADQGDGDNMDGGFDPE